MPARAYISKELAKLLSVLSHPHRIRIIEELRAREMDVNSLQAVLGVAHSGVSQHLSLLRSHRLVSERREGRHVYYHLTQPKLAQWLMAGLEFLEGNVHQAEEMREALEETRTMWGSGPVSANRVTSKEPSPDAGVVPARIGSELGAQANMRVPSSKDREDSATSAASGHTSAPSDDSSLEELTVAESSYRAG
jgi:DNA-binding transcriptional ArsR family regulator